jgi:hypothetical protein
MNVKGTEISHRYSFTRQRKHKLQAVKRAVKVLPRTVSARQSTVRIHVEASLISHCSGLASYQSDCSLDSSRDIEEGTRGRLPRDDNGGEWGTTRKGRGTADCKNPCTYMYVPVDNCML